MKTILSALLILSALPAFARDWTYSTNLFSGLTGPTNIFCGTNSTDSDRDSYIVIWNKLNANFNFLWDQNQVDGLTISNVNALVTGLTTLNTITNHQTGVTLTGTFGGNFAGGLVTNSVLVRSTVTNSILTNSTYAGDGHYLTSVNGKNITSSTVNSNAFDTATRAQLFAGIPAGGLMNFDSGTIISDGSGNATVNTLGTQQWFAGTGSGASLDQYGNFNLGTGFGSGNYWQAVYNYGEYHGLAVGYDDTAPFSIIPLLIGLLQQSVYTAHSTLDDGNGNMSVYGTFASDSTQIYSDGAGNLTAQTFNPVSDRAHKENIQPFAASTALDMARSLTNFTWRFKGTTNYVSTIKRLTNSVAVNGLTLVTNITAKIRPATGKEFGPMAQDWHRVTGLGGGTNISLTSMNGLLLGAVQGLDQKLSADELHPQIPFYAPPTSGSTTFGYGAGLLAMDANNLYVSTGTNLWRRINLPTNSW